ncbi:TPA: hypothetical protein DEP94_02040 [Candidatus Nomurabacteria bacterium]|nr:hypothetical protein [Candidatus Nomurabacteria bacterium]
MPNNINNWQYKDVVSFLKENGFTLNHIRGSHYYYVGTVNKIMRHVSVPYHGTALKPRTMKSIIEQSGIQKEIWFGKGKRK